MVPESYLLANQKPAKYYIIEASQFSKVISLEWMTKMASDVKNHDSLYVSQEKVFVSKIYLELSIYVDIPKWD